MPPQKYPVHLVEKTDVVSYGSFTPTDDYLLNAASGRFRKLNIINPTLTIGGVYRP